MSTQTSIALGRIAPSQTVAMTDRAIELREAGRDIISLSVGEPDFATPPHVIAAAKAALDAGDTKYTAVGGTAAMKRAAALHFSRDLGIETSPGRVVVSAGGKQAKALALALDVGNAAVPGNADGKEEARQEAEMAIEIDRPWLRDMQELRS